MNKNLFMMSYFQAPIAKYSDAAGHLYPASLRPVANISLEQLVQLITGNEQLRQLTDEVRHAPDLGEAKKQKLPFITPMGCFSYRKSDSLLQASGLLVIDLDGELTPAEAEALRDRLFLDPWLRPVLCFVSPSGQGVKALIPYRPDAAIPVQEDITANLRMAMDYMQGMYSRTTTAQVDVSGKDVVRSCFLCHDAHAKYRLADKCTD